MEIWAFWLIFRPKCTNTFQIIDQKIGFTLLLYHRGKKLQLLSIGIIFSKFLNVFDVLESQILESDAKQYHFLNFEFTIN